MRRALVLLALGALACDRKPAKEEAAPSAAPARSVLPPAPPLKVEVPEVRIRAEGATTVRVAWLTPQGTAVNDDAPFRVRWNRSDGLADAPSDVKSTGSAVKDGFKVSVRPMKGASHPALAGEIDIVVCDAATHSVCVPVRREVELDFVSAADASEIATVSIPLPSAR
jgi:hypothetical protein